MLCLQGRRLRRPSGAQWALQELFELSGLREKAEKAALKAWVHLQFLRPRSTQLSERTAASVDDSRFLALKVRSTRGLCVAPAGQSRLCWPDSLCISNTSVLLKCLQSAHL